VVAMANRKAVDLLVGHMSKSTRTMSRTFRAYEPDERVANFSLSYLDAFGYLKNELEKWKDITLGDIVEAVKDFQGMFGLRKSGQVCVKTVRAMEMPRCGCPDHVRPWQNYAAVRNFARANLAKWQKDNLKYGIQDYLPGLSKPDFESIIYQSFQAWCRYGHVQVEPVRMNERPDIIIATGRGRQSNFDGPGGTLAWAYLPNGNDQQLTMKFDLDETWTQDPTMRGVLLDAVAKHEFGHLFGLDHSRVQQALMAAYYNPAVRNPQQNDDIPRFQARYGVKQPGDDGGTTPPPSGNNRRLILEGVFSATLDGQKVA